MEKKYLRIVQSQSLYILGILLWNHHGSAIHMLPLTRRTLHYSSSVSKFGRFFIAHNHTRFSLRGGVQQSDCMSPYDTNSLRELSEFIDDNPESIVPDPPRPIYRPPTREPASLANCISPSDLTHPREEDDVDPPPDIKHQHDQFDWPQHCL